MPPLWSVKPSSPRRLWRQETNSAGGLTHGESWINYRYMNPTPPIYSLKKSQRRDPFPIPLHLATPTNTPKLCIYRLFKTSFATSPYLNTGPQHYLRWALLRFRCSNHRLDIELGRHLNVPRDERACRFCRKPKLGDEYHVFQCEAFMDLQVLCGVNVTSFPQFIECMQILEINVQRCISLIMSRIKLR